MLRQLNDISLRERDEIMSSKPVVLMGSGISMCSPTNLPSGITVGEKLYDYIFFDDELKTEKYAWLKEEIANIPFEAIMECFPHTKDLPKIISQIYSCDVPNEFHKIFADNLAKGNFSALVTTNYDLAFETALHQVGCKARVVKDEDLTALNGKLDKIYFKIHGSADKEETLIYTLSQEGKLHKWKTDLLEELIKDRAIIILCYSGRDFDICPFIGERDMHQKMLWIHFMRDPLRDSLSAYQEYLVKVSVKNEIVSGSIQEFTDSFLSKPIAWRTGTTDFDPPVYFKLTEAERLEWRLVLLSRIACPELGSPLVKRLKGKMDERKLVLIQCEMYGHTGEYEKEAREFCHLASLYPKNSKEHISALIRTSEAWLKLGNLFKRRKYLRAAINALNKSGLQDQELSTIILEQDFTLLNKVKQLFRSKIFFFVHRYIDTRMTNAVSKIEYLRASGLWDRRQVVQHIMERLEIRSRTNFSLPAFIGFKNLGLSGMAIIAYRDKIRYKKWEVGEKQLQFLDDCLMKAERLGMKTELWKYCRIKLKETNLSLPQKLEIWKKWKAALRTTEYGVIRRLYEKISLFKYGVKVMAERSIYHIRRP